MKTSVLYLVIGLGLTGCSQHRDPSDETIVPLPDGTRIVVPVGHDPTALRALSGEPTNRTGRVVELRREAHLYFGPIR